MLNMKKLLSLLLVLCLFAPTALAGLGNEPNHYVRSVVDSEKSLKKYKELDKYADLSILMPGLAQTFIPQGLAYYAPGNLMLFSGYHHGGTYSSTLLAVDMNTNQVVKEILLAQTDGDVYTGHAGGVCVTDQNIFFSDEGCLYRLPLSDFLSAAPLDVLGFAEKIPVPCKASYCQISNGVLWVGEFYEDSDPRYHTDESHHVKLGKKETNHSWLLGYKLNGGTVNELDPACLTSGGAVPDYILSTTDNIQGMTMIGDSICLSQSYGRKNDSALYFYDNVIAGAPDDQVSVMGMQRPIWHLDSTDESKTIKCPPMTENLCTVNGSVYISFESAADYYRVPRDDKGKSKQPVDRLVKLTPSFLDGSGAGHSF